MAAKVMQSMCDPKLKLFWFILTNLQFLMTKFYNCKLFECHHVKIKLFSSTNTYVLACCPLYILMMSHSSLLSYHQMLAYIYYTMLLSVDIPDAAYTCLAFDLLSHYSPSVM